MSSHRFPVRYHFDTMRKRQLLAAAFAFTFAFAAFAQATFGKAQIKVAGHPLKVEVAANDAALQQGLMFREKLGRDEGMLFVFGEPAYHSMWMKDTLIALSVAFLDADGRILNILDMEPQTLNTHTAAGPAVYAIETNKGWFAGKKVKAGDKVTGLPRAKN